MRHAAVCRRFSWQAGLSKVVALEEVADVAQTTEALRDFPGSRAELVGVELATCGFRARVAGGPRTMLGC